MATHQTDVGTQQRAAARAAAIAILVTGGMGLVHAPAVQAQEFAWQPVSATGGHTILGNEIALDSPGQQVTLELQLRGWVSAPGSPELGAYVVNVDPAGYSSGIGSPLNPLGWPGTPGDGAFIDDPRCELSLGRCANDAECPGGEPCVGHLDFVFTGFPGYATDVRTTSLSYEWVSAIPSGQKVDDGGTYYGGTLILDVPVGAAGTYVIGFVAGPDFTRMQDAVGNIIFEPNLTSATITVSASQGAVPTISEWGVAVIALLIVTGATVLIRRQTHVA